MGASSQLPTHATGASRRRDVRRHGHGLEVAVSLGDRPAERHPLSTRPHGVGGVLDVRAGDVAPRPGEDDGADPELAVGAVRRGLGGDGVPLEAVELVRGEVICPACRFDVLVALAGEEWWSGSHFDQVCFTMEASREKGSCEESVVVCP